MNKLITLIFILISLSTFSQEINLDSEANKILKKGIAYSKIIIANELTLSEVNREQFFVFSYYFNNQITSIVFSKKPENKQIIQTIVYSDSLKILKNDKIVRDKSPDEELFVKMYYNMYASTLYFPHLPKDFWSIIEKKSDRFDSFMFPQQNDNNNIILGNDYLFVYKLDGEFKDFKHLHNNPIPMSIYKPSDAEIILHTHSNKNSNFISELDVANMIICKNKLQWTEHYVVSKKYVSIFNMGNMNLKIELRKDYETRTGKKLKL
jgi:hypothetical protein